MRLWTIHPRYLDTKGLLAAWREGLLAQQVLRGKTKGYTKHPQLIRFNSTTNPTAAIAGYLRGIHSEAVNRNYCFKEEKIGPTVFAQQILCTRGQLLYEWTWFREKVRLRDPNRYAAVNDITEPEPHPIFKIVEGGVEDWEVRRSPNFVSQKIPASKV